MGKIFTTRKQKEYDVIWEEICNYLKEKGLYDSLHREVINEKTYSGECLYGDDVFRDDYLVISPIRKKDYSVRGVVEYKLDNEDKCFVGHYKSFNGFKNFFEKCENKEDNQESM